MAYRRIGGDPNIWVIRCGKDRTVRNATIGPSTARETETAMSSSSSRRLTPQDPVGRRCPSPWACSACRPMPPTPSKGRRAAQPVGHDGDLETVLKDTVLMAIDEINAKGRRAGQEAQPVVVDPASNWPLFAEGQTADRPGQGRRRVRLLDQRCRASRCCRCSRELNSLLFYPVQYEGEELSRTCSTPAPRPTSRPFPRSTT